VRVAERLVTREDTGLFGRWSLPDAELAFMLHRLILNGHALPSRVRVWAERAREALPSSKISKNPLPVCTVDAVEYVASMIREWTRGEYAISTDPKRLDLDVIHAFLVRSFWAEGIPRDVMERSIANFVGFWLGGAAGADDHPPRLARPLRPSPAAGACDAAHPALRLGQRRSGVRPPLPLRSLSRRLCW